MQGRIRGRERRGGKGRLTIPMTSLDEFSLVYKTSCCEKDRDYSDTTVAPEAVWQVGRPPYQSEIWYGGAIPIQ